MNLLAEMALKSAAILLLALAATTLLQRYSAALRHAILAAAFACAAAVPALTLWAPEWRVPVPASWLRFESLPPVRFANTSPPVSAAPTSREAPPPSTAPMRATTSQIVVGVWLVGALAGLGSTYAGIWRVRRFARGARPVERGAWREHADDIAALYGVRRSVRLLQSTHPTMLVTWGHMQPRVLLPVDAATWSDERIRVVLYHELAHVQRHDWAILIAARVLRALYWFNPLVWIAFRRLRHESERACDDVVILRGVTAPDYASHLLAIARETVLHRGAWSTATAIAHPSTLEGRVRAMLNEGLNRTPLTMRGRWVAAIVSLVTAFAIAGAGVAAFAAPDDAREVTSPQPSSVAVDVPAAPNATIELSNATVALGSARVSATRARAEAAPAVQASPGSLRGVLYDQLGGLLPGAQVHLVHRLDGATYNALTDRDGSFLFTALPAGDYELNTSLIGFATVSNLIKVTGGETIERALTLPIGTLEETVSVTGGDRSQPQRRTEWGRAGTTRSAPERRTFFSGGIGGQIKAPSKLVHVSPVFPANAADRGDVVVLTGRVGIDGFINDLREVTPSPTVAASHDAFVTSALDAVSQWEFTPVLLNNVPVEAHITIRVDYSAR
jgi:beta-lactamase regulating signal transducer with metallopeptidase domain